MTVVELQQDEQVDHAAIVIQEAIANGRVSYEHGIQRAETDAEGWLRDIL